MIEVGAPYCSADEAFELGMVLCDGFWLAPYEVVFPIGSTLDWKHDELNDEL